MKKLTETVQSGDWKNEKHVPVIHLPEDLSAEKIEIKVVVGDEIAHPNTLEHHIAWMKLFFMPEDGKFPVEIGSYECSAHGEAEIFSEPVIKACVKLPGNGVLQALSYCNLHGLWESSVEFKK